MGFRFDQFTYHYFSQDDKHFQRKLTELEEFRELSLPETPGSVPPKGEFYPHQVVGERFLNIWDSALFDNEPGVGKTGTVYAAAISFNRGMVMSPEEAYLAGRCNWITKTVIIVPNETLERVWRRAYPQYSGGAVLPHNIIIYRRDSFYLQHKDLSNSQLIAIFRNSFIAIDEVHELLNRSNPDDKPKYDWFRNFLQVVPNIKVALLTGTVIIMNPSELGFTMNLLPGISMPTLKPGKKAVQDNPWWNEVATGTAGGEGEQKLARFLSGRVSHVKNVQDRSILTYPKRAVPLGDLIPMEVETDIKVIPVTMSKLQSELYYNVYLDDRNPFNVVAINAALSIIPPEFRSKGKKEQYLKRLERNLDFARSVAAKLVEALDIAMRSKGIVFIVSRYVDKSGNVLERLLKGAGYEEYKVSKKRNQKNGGAAALQLELPPLIEKGAGSKRYVSIRAQTPYNAALLDLVGKYKNRHGDYVKIVLTSRVGAIGITVRNVQTYIVLDPDAHISGEEQREKRMFRPGSHDDLYYERLSQGMSPEKAVVKVRAYRLVAIPVHQGKGRKGDIMEYEDSVDLTTYRHIVEGDLELHRIRIASNRIAFDAQLHLLRNQCPKGSEEKKKQEKPLDFESLSLTECYYGFYDQPAGKTKYRTYDLLYANRQVSIVIKDLISILVVEGSIIVSDFLNRPLSSDPTKRYADILSKLGIYKLISSALYTSSFALPLFSDYGTRVYLGAVRDTLFLQTDLNSTLGLADPSKGGHLWPDTYFYANLITAARDPLEYFVSYQKQRFKSIDELDHWLSLVDIPDVPLEMKIETMESIVIEYFTSPQPSVALQEQFKFIWKRYSNKVFFKFNKPTGRLLFVSGATLNPKIRGEIDVLGLPDLHGPEEEDVYLHVLYAQFSEVGVGGYSIYKSHIQAKQITLFDQRLGKFVRLRPPMAEFYVYSAPIQDIISSEFKEFIKSFNETSGPRGADAQKIFGLIYDPETNFKIYDKRRPPTKTKKQQSNKAKESRGKSCKSFALHLLVDIAIALGINPNDPANPEDPNSPPLVSKDKLNVRKIKFDDRKVYSNAKSYVNSKPALLKTVKANPQFYLGPANARNFILFAQWTAVYGVQGQMSKDKNPLCTAIYDRLDELGQVYFF